MSLAVPRSFPLLASAARTATNTADFSSDNCGGLVLVTDVTALAVAAKEITTVDIGTSTGGTFTLTYDGQETSALTFDDIAGDIETAVEALSTVTTATVTGGGFTKEVATIDIGTSTGGTFTLTVDAVETAAIVYNASAAVVKAALELISTVTTVTVTGTGATGTPWVCTFDDPLKDLVVDGTSSLTGGDTILTVTETTPGVAPAAWVITVDTATLNFIVTGDGANLTGGNSTLTLVETQRGSSGSGGITVSIGLVDTTSGQVVNQLTSATVSTVSTQALRVAPGLVAAANLTVNDVVPNTVRVTVTHDSTDEITYTVAAHLVNT